MFYGCHPGLTEQQDTVSWFVCGPPPYVCHRTVPVLSAGNAWNTLLNEPILSVSLAICIVKESLFRLRTNRANASALMRSVIWQCVAYYNLICGLQLNGQDTQWDKVVPKINGCTLPLAELNSEQVHTKRESEGVRSLWCIVTVK